jgi:hypothetical protein
MSDAPRWRVAALLRTPDPGGRLANWLEHVARERSGRIRTSAPQGWTVYEFPDELKAKRFIEAGSTVGKVTTAA